MRNVWEFPRPPAVQPVSRRVRVILGGVTIVDTADAVEVLETTHPPVIYVRREEVAASLKPARHRDTWCEFKGTCIYLDVDGVECGAWAYPKPVAGYEALADRVAFYANRMDACFLDDEQVHAQEGGFYGGWITADLEGPFKGPAGTVGW